MVITTKEDVNLAMSPWNTPTSISIPDSLSNFTKYKKNVLDVVDGYHAIELHPEIQELTTFITEWRYFMNLRLPQGFGEDAYTRHYENAIKGIPCKVKIVDDMS